MVADGKKLDLYREYHKNQAVFPGNSLYDHISAIGNLVAELGILSVLDYGCGKGLQYTKHKTDKAWGGGVGLLTLYDPAVPEYAKRPEGRFDLVICTDVLEHIPEDEIPAVLEDINNYAMKAVFLSICTRKAVAILPNGENAHCTIKSQEWWKELINKSFGVEKELRLVFSR